MEFVYGLQWPFLSLEDFLELWKLYALNYEPY